MKNLFLLLIAFCLLNNSFAQTLYPPTNFTCRLVITYSGNPQASDETVVYFNAASNDQFLSTEDAPKFPQTNALNIYSVVSSHILAINAMGSITGERFINIGYQVPSASTVTISYNPVQPNEIGNYNGNAIMEIMDMNLNTAVSVLPTGSYSFTSATGTFNNRIRLHVAPGSYAFTAPGTCTSPGRTYITNFGLTPVDYEITDQNFVVQQSGTSFTGITEVQLPYPGNFQYNYTSPGQASVAQSYPLIPDYSSDLPLIDMLYVTDTAIDINTSFEAMVSWAGYDPSADSAYWDFGDNTGSWGFYGSHTYAAAGIYPVTVTAYGDSCSSTFSFHTQVYTLTATEGKNESELQSFCDGSQFTWTNKGRQPQSGTWSVYDLSGRLVFVKNVLLSPGSSSAYGINELPAGFYTSIFSANNQVKQVKFSVLHP